MAKIQSRRSVSINRSLYERLRSHSEATGEPMAQLAERALLALIGTPVKSDPATTSSVDRPRGSRSVLAAEYARDNGVTYQEAADRFGLTRAAVGHGAARIGYHGLVDRRGTGGGRARIHALPTRLFLELGSRTAPAANDVIRGMTIAEAALKHGITPAAIYGFLRCPPISAIDQDAA